MPTVLIASSVLQGKQARHTEILEQAGFDIQIPDPPCAITDEALLAKNLSGIYGVLAGSEPFTAKVLEQSPDLKVIARVGVGYDAVDVDAATERGIAVAITPGTNQESVAEITFSLMLALAKRLVTNHERVRAGSFDREMTEPIRGKTLGIIGLGRIGLAVARLAQAFRMPVIGYDPVVQEVPDELEIRRASLGELLAESDYVSLHAPSTPETRHMINAEAIAQMKDGAALLNTARGNLVDETALIAALDAGKLSGAGLDVFEVEPPTGRPILHARNIVFSPHVGGIDSDGLQQMANMSAQSIVDLYEGRWPTERLVNEAGLRGRFVSG